MVGVAVDSSGEYGAATSLDSVVSVWSMASSQPVARFEQPPSETWSLTFVPGADAPLLAVAGGSSHSVQLLDVGGQAEARVLAMPAVSERDAAAAPSPSVACVRLACVFCSVEGEVRFQSSAPLQPGGTTPHPAALSLAVFPRRSWRRARRRGRSSSCSAWRPAPTGGASPPAA